MFRGLIVVLFFLCSNAASFAQQGKEQQQVDFTVPGAPMPYFRLQLLDTAKKNPPTGNLTKKQRKEAEVDTVINKGKFNSAEFNHTGNTLVMLFSPTCDHCEAMTRLLESNINLFRDTKLVLMTNVKFREYLPGFMKKLHTLDFPQMVVGLDDTDYIKNTFLYQTLPQINIYGRDRKLIRICTGDTPIDTIKPYIN